MADLESINQVFAADIAEGCNDIMGPREMITEDAVPQGTNVPLAHTAIIMGSNTSQTDAP